MVSPDGLKIIYITTVILIIFCVITYFIPHIALKISTILIAVIFIFNLFFFRDPERTIPEGEDLILSPADGTVIMIEEVFEPNYFKKNVRRVSIFLSVFNVHVNRIPITGKVDYLKYVEGKYLLAFEPKSSEENEQSVIGISNGENRLLFKQIAGIIARRIIYHVSEGDSVIAGDRFGLIRYGSRVDMFFPENVELQVGLKDKVYGGETIIGVFK